MSALGSIRKRDWVFSIDLKDAYFQILVHPESQLFHQFCLEGCLSVLCTVPQSVHGPTVVHQSLRSGFVVGALEGCESTPLRGQLAGH